MSYAKLTEEEKLYFIARVKEAKDKGLKRDQFLAQEDISAGSWTIIGKQLGEPGKVPFTKPALGPQPKRGPYKKNADISKEDRNEFRKFQQENELREKAEQVRLEKKAKAERKAELRAEKTKTQSLFDYHQVPLQPIEAKEKSCKLRQYLLLLSVDAETLVTLLEKSPESKILHTFS